MPAATATLVKFSEILITTDFQEESDRALVFAKAIAHGTEAEIFLVHVSEPAALMAIPEGEWVDKAMILQREEAAAEAAGAALREEGLRASAFCCYGNITQEIARECRERHVDLVVTGTHGRHGLLHFLIGSHAESLAKQVDVPVLIVGPRCAPLTQAEWKPATIICCVEMTEEGAVCASYACRLAKEYGATLTIAHTPVTSHRETFGGWLDFKRAIDALLPIDFGNQPSLRSIAMDGLGADTLVEFAIADDAGLLLLPARHRMFEFIAAKPAALPYLMAAAPCPILTVPTQIEQSR